MSDARRLSEILQLVLEQTVMTTLTDGTAVKIGSERHIQDLEVTLRRLQHLRDNYPRTSANRAVYANACNKLSRQIRMLRSRAVPVPVERAPRV